jgi:hypothetical protein
VRGFPGRIRPRTGLNGMAHYNPDPDECNGKRTNRLETKTTVHYHPLTENNSSRIEITHSGPQLFVNLIWYHTQKGLTTPDLPPLEVPK